MKFGKKEFQNMEESRAIKWEPLALNQCLIFPRMDSSEGLLGRWKDDMKSKAMIILRQVGWS